MCCAWYALSVYSRVPAPPGWKIATAWMWMCKTMEKVQKYTRSLRQCFSISLPYEEPEDGGRTRPFHRQYFTFEHLQLLHFPCYLRGKCGLWYEIAKTHTHTYIIHTLYILGSRTIGRFVINLWYSGLYTLNYINILSGIRVRGLAMLFMPAGGVFTTLALCCCFFFRKNKAFQVW